MKGCMISCLVVQTIMILLEISKKFGQFRRNIINTYFFADWQEIFDWTNISISYFYCISRIWDGRITVRMNPFKIDEELKAIKNLPNRWLSNSLPALGAIICATTTL